MFDFHEKRKIKSWVFSKSSIVILLALSLWFSGSVYERYKKERETAHTYTGRAAELGALKQQAAVLQEKVRYIQSDRGIEDEIRDRYDVVKKGERVAIVMDAPEADVSRESTATEATTTQSFLSRLFFFWR